jgi:hypothetical protein
MHGPAWMRKLDLHTTQQIRRKAKVVFQESLLLDCIHTYCLR